MCSPECHKRISNLPLLNLNYLCNFKIDILQGTTYSYIKQFGLDYNANIILTPVYLDIPYIDLIHSIQIISEQQIVYTILAQELFMLKPILNTIYELPKCFIKTSHRIEIIIRTISPDQFLNLIEPIEHVELKNSKLNKLYKNKLDRLFQKLDIIDDIKKIIASYISLPIFKIHVYSGNKAGANESWLLIPSFQPYRYSETIIRKIQPYQNEIYFEYETRSNKLKDIVFYFAKDKYDTDFLDVLDSIRVTDEVGTMYYDRSMCLLTNQLFFQNAFHDNIYGMPIPFKTNNIIYDQYDNSTGTFVIKFNPVQYSMILCYSLHFN